MHSGHLEGHDPLLMLRPGDTAPDFTMGDRTLHEMLEERKVVLFFFPKTFTAG